MLTALVTSIDNSRIVTYNILYFLEFWPFVRDIVTKYIVNDFLNFFKELVSSIPIATF